MIPDDAVEAAYAHLGSDGAGFRYVNKARVRELLQAAAPFIAAKALEDAADSIDGGGSISKWLRTRAESIRSTP